MAARPSPVRSKVEGEFLREVAATRWPVLVLIASFDLACLLVRVLARMARARSTAGGAVAVLRGLPIQVANLGALYALMHLLNWRARRLGHRAARQEEWLLSLLLAAAIGVLLASLRGASAHAGDYVYAAFFLICTSSVLKFRWWLGTAVLALPTGLVLWQNLPTALAAAGAPAAAATAAACATGGGSCPAGDGTGGGGGLSLEALVHLLVAWAVGGLMAFVSDSNRRQAFMHHRLALAAAGKEVREARSRVEMERALAAAQAQAATRAISVAQEKAANEAKSEFMSLMCHEVCPLCLRCLRRRRRRCWCGRGGGAAAVAAAHARPAASTLPAQVRTPLNGCLASAEMLLDTPLSEDQRELAKTIRVSGSILLSTVSNFLDFFKLGERGSEGRGREAVRA